MKPYSTRLGKENNANWNNALTLQSLFPAGGRVRDVTIISAYTDVNMLRKVCKEALTARDLRSSARIRIFLDRQASTYDTNPPVCKKLNALANRLRDVAGDGSGIWLVRTGPLMHSKAMVVQTNTEVVCMVGSINTTRRAYEKNEELALIGQANVEGKSSAAQIGRWLSTQYADCLIARAERIPVINQSLTHDSLQSLMLGGVMFHQIKENDPFRFVLGLPEEFLSVSQDVHPLLRAELRDSVSVETIVTHPGVGLGYSLPSVDDDSVKERWKQYCLDTCYGYWCPGALREEAEQAVASNRSLRKPKFEGTDSREGLFAIVKNRKEDIFVCFSEVIDAISKDIRRRGFAEDSWDPSRVCLRWAQWYERLEHKITSEIFRDRLILGVYDKPVPNVWSDPITASEFEASFIESLQYASTKRSNKLIRKLGEAYQLDQDLIRKCTPAEIATYLEERLSSAANLEVESEDDL